MSDDILEVKIPLGLGKLNVNALWRLRGKPKNNPAHVVAERFLEIFKVQGVTPTQIPQFLPQVTLDQLYPPEKLLVVLTRDVLEKTASLFGVRLPWLEGVGDQIYECKTCYKHPQGFFEDLRRIHEHGDSFPVRALYSGRPLDGNVDRGQALVLLLAERIRDLGEEEICRYLVYGDAWDWGYAPSRLQLKAMARIMDTVFSQPVPLYPTKPSILEKVRLGELVPRAFVDGSPLTNPSLEDYALSPQESRQAKECEELPAVLDYIKSHNLQSIAAGGQSSPSIS